MSLRSVQFVRSVKVLTVRQEEFTVHKLHVISDTSNIFGFGCTVVEGSNVFTVRSFRTVRKNPSQTPLDSQSRPGLC